MKIEIRRYNHAVGEFNYHIQLTPAYRKRVFVDERVTKLLRAYLLSKAEELKVQIVEMKGGPDHFHIFVVNCKNIAPCKLIQYFKGFTSRMLRKNHWSLFRHLLYGDKFWAEGYFCRSIGATTTEAVEYYIKYSQDKHWSNVDYEVHQAQLNQF